MYKLILCFFLVFSSLAEPKALNQHLKQEEYQQSLGKRMIKQARLLGLVDLHKYAGVEVKNYPFAHPAFVWLLGRIQQKGFKIWRITEGFPATVRHSSKHHFNGRAIDFTVRDPKQAKAVCNFINSKKGFKCLNEYKIGTKYRTGAHLHVEYVGI